MCASSFDLLTQTGLGESTLFAPVSSQWRLEVPVMGCDVSPQLRVISRFKKPEESLSLVFLPPFVLNKLGARRAHADVESLLSRVADAKRQTVAVARAPHSSCGLPLSINCYLIKTKDSFNI